MMYVQQKRMDLPGADVMCGRGQEKHMDFAGSRQNVRTGVEKQEGSFRLSREVVAHGRRGQENGAFIACWFF